MCAALALLDLPPTAKLPPLECLFTIDEETGLTGAFQLDGSMLQGRVMLNLDTEDWPEVFIGCAGGGDSVLKLRAAGEAPPAGQAALEVRVSGLLGGHSGINIHEDRGNALRMAAEVAEAVLAALPGSRLVSVGGGDKVRGSGGGLCIAATPLACVVVVTFTPLRCHGPHLPVTLTALGALVPCLRWGRIHSLEICLADCSFDTPKHALVCLTACSATPSLGSALPW